MRNTIATFWDTLQWFGGFASHCGFLEGNFQHFYALWNLFMISSIVQLELAIFSIPLFRRFHNQMVTWSMVGGTQTPYHYPAIPLVGHRFKEYGLSAVVCGRKWLR